MNLIALALVGLACRCLSKELPDFQSFVTEPDITVVTIDVIKHTDPEALAPGYIFLAPYKSLEGWGPQIFESNGELVWFGGDLVKKRAIDLQPCLFNSSSFDHLCFNDAQPVEQRGHSSGEIRVFDNTYTQVGEDYGATNGLRAPDIHEMNAPTAQKGKTFIQDVYEVRPTDLTEWAGPKDGFVLDGCFQEIDWLSRDIVFQWCSVEHIPFETTYVYLPNSGNYSIPGLAGSGQRNAPWDWFHINAIDRNEAGDYVISSRHLNSILHVAGPDNKEHEPGSLIWALGGKLNNFTMENDLNFSAQHTVRYVSQETPGHMTISLFNNAFEGHTSTSKMSYGMLINLDLETMQASLKARFVRETGVFSQDQGGVKILPNGNAFVGWGRCNYFSEHAPSGELLYYAQFGGKGDCDTGPDKFFVSSFRAWKSPWIGDPQYPPKAVAYAHTCSSRVHMYVSWNGATEVAFWDIYASNDTATKSSSYNHVGRFEKKGFETLVKLDLSRVFFVQAADKDGDPLGANSQVVETFVPRPHLKCDEEKCENINIASGNYRSIVEQCTFSTEDAEGSSSDEGNRPIDDSDSSTPQKSSGSLPILYLVRNGVYRMLEKMPSG